MTNDSKNLCRECAELFDGNGYPVEKLPPTAKSVKCANCKEKRPVAGVLREGRVSRR